MYTLVKIIPNKSTTLFKGKIGPKKKNSDTKEDKKGQTESEIIILWMCQGAIHEKGEGVDLIKSATVSAESKHNGSSFSKLNPLKRRVRLCAI